LKAPDYSFQLNNIYINFKNISIFCKKYYFIIIRSEATPAIKYINKIYPIAEYTKPLKNYLKEDSL